MRYVRIPYKRFEEWLNVLDLVEEYSRKLRERLGRVTVILYGNYAHGDFNLWSDIDLIIVSEKFNGVRILDRYDLLPTHPAGVEPIPLTPEEFRRNLEDKTWIKALNKASVTIIDDYNLTKYLIARNIKPLQINKLRKKIKILKHKYSEDNEQ